jgi:cytochrome c peroxidase
MRLLKIFVLAAAAIICGSVMIEPHVSAQSTNELDERLRAVLRENEFTGDIESQLERKLGRSINKKLADLGRLLFFDSILSINGDTSCASCHSPAAGFADTLSISIGVGNNGVVGPGRRGPHNMRRAPTVINTAFYRRLMWDARFASWNNDAFDNGGGFGFPAPEGRSLSYLPHLLIAQAFIPTTNRTEMAGHDFEGDSNAMRDEVARRVNGVKAYKKKFKKVFSEVKAGGPITYEMIARAIAEFEFTLTFANAPIDRFARGERKAMTEDEKRGALLFFSDNARCGACHSVAGESWQMFSSFVTLAVGVPPIVPQSTNVEFDGPGRDEDFGAERVTGDINERYRFRVAPLRNLAVQRAFFHNGAFTSLDDVIRHYINTGESLRNYDVSKANIAARLGPIDPVLQKIDPIAAGQLILNEDEVRQLTAFVRDALLDPRARPENLRSLIPDAVPSGRPLPVFE